MAKYTDADCRLCRREGAKLFLKGDRCLSKKCAMERRPSVPGQHPNTRRKPIIKQIILNVEKLIGSLGTSSVIGPITIA